LIGAHPACSDQARESGLLQRSATFREKSLHHRLHEGSGYIGASLKVIVGSAQRGGCVGLEAAEAEVEPRSLRHGARENKAVGPPAGGEPFDLWPSRVAQAQELCNLIEGFSRGIVDRAPQGSEIQSAVAAVYIRMPPAGNQTNTRKNLFATSDTAGIDVGLQMINSY
jgi:hypothetical protein